MARTAAALILVYTLAGTAGHAAKFDMVINNGRVMDPASGLDAIRHLGIRDGRIVRISRRKLKSEQLVDADGLVVSPGFIDLHAHGQDHFGTALQARDGVTTSLELEAGSYPIAPWYADRSGRALINYGASASHIGIRAVAMTTLTEQDLTAPNALARALALREWVVNPPSANELVEIQLRVKESFEDGALGLGFGLGYTPGATREEVWRLFALASEHRLLTYVHMRFDGVSELGGSIDALQEQLANAASTGAALHLCHIGSSGGSRLPLMLEMIDQARVQGVNVTTEVYPYTAWSTFIGAATFDGDWRSREGIDFQDLELPTTGERLTAESFARLRSESPETFVIGHAMQAEFIDLAIAHPGVIISSDSIPYVNGRAHPRGAGTYARVLGHYVRERGVLSLMDALAKMSWLPAQRLQASVPQMRRKGRISKGADADLVIFDPAMVRDEATFGDPAKPSTGILHVIVGGVPLVRNGVLLKNTYPGQAIRRTATSPGQKP